MSHRGGVRGQWPGPACDLGPREARTHRTAPPEQSRGGGQVSLGVWSLWGCGVPFLGPERRQARRRSGKAETGSRRPSRPARGLVAPHLRTPSGNAAASSPARAATAGCSRTCRLALPGDVEGRRGPQNRVAAQLPEWRGAERRRALSRSLRRRRRRPRGPSTWPRPASGGRRTGGRAGVHACDVTPLARGRHNIAGHVHHGGVIP